MKLILMTMLAIWLMLTCRVDSQLWNNHPASILTDRTWKKLSSNIWSQMEEKEVIASSIGQALHQLLIALKSTSFPTAVASNVSRQCREDSQFYVHSLYRNLSGWAIKMQESSGHMPPGLFGSYNLKADGLFDECQDVQAPHFQGQYCTVAFNMAPVDPSEILPAPKDEMNERARNPLAFYNLLGLLSGSQRVEPKLVHAEPDTYGKPSISFCLPSSCSAQDLGQAIAEIVGSYVISNQSLVTIADEQYCFKRTDDSPSLDAIDITVTVVFSLLGLLVLTATTHEGWRIFHNASFNAATDSQVINFLHCFSVLNNGRKLLSLKISTKSGDNFGCIHGIRFFSTLWVVIGHWWIFSLTKLINPLALYNDAFGWKLQTITNAFVSVDTFFLMSGLLVSYLLLKELDRNKGRLNVGMLYLHRYVRLTVVYAFILAFVASLMVYTGTGPNWYSVTLSSNACRKIWWRQFLYINNLFPSDPYLQCMAQTWYLAVDMQLYLVAPFLIYPLWRWRRLGFAWMAFVTVACHAAVFAIYAVYDLAPNMMLTRVSELESLDQYFAVYYAKPWTRAPPYLVGIWIGWYLHITKEKQMKLPKLIVVTGWTLSTVVALAIVYGLTPYLDENKVPEIEPIVKMTYGPLHRTAWGMVIGWIIFACSRGYGGFVNSLLSWKGFLPLGRLTYCVYLIHYDLINVVVSANRKQFYYTFFGELVSYLGILVVSFALAFVASVTIEASFLNLEKLVFSPKIDDSKGKSPSNPT